MNKRKKTFLLAVLSKLPLFKGWILSIKTTCIHRTQTILIAKLIIIYILYKYLMCFLKKNFKIIYLNYFYVNIINL